MPALGIVRGEYGEGNGTPLSRKRFEHVWVRVALDARLTATATVYAQPRLDDPADLRLLAEATLSSKLSGRVTLTQRLTLARDASPPDGIERTDSTLELEVGLAL